MTFANKIIAFLSYLLLLPGCLIVLIFRRKFPSELGHARQSMVINLAAFSLLLIWFVLTWLLISIPIIGPITAWFAFTIVIIAWIFFIGLWIMGMVRAFRGSLKPLAIVGRWAAKLPF
jgi:uncharacterized membrane protein